MLKLKELIDLQLILPATNNDGKETENIIQIERDLPLIFSTNNLANKLAHFIPDIVVSHKKRQFMQAI